MSIQVGNLTVNPGGKVSGMLAVVNHSLQLPVTLVAGVNPGPTLLITAGIHGAEYIGIETAIQIAAELDPKQLSGNVIILRMANPDASYDFRRLVVPEDNCNLNRAFPGDQEGGLSQKIAYTIEHQLHKKADYYVDLHGGDTHEMVMPFVFFGGNTEEKVLQQARAMADSLNLAVRVKSSATTGSYSYAGLQGVPAVLIERGGGGVWTQPQVEAYKTDLRNVMIHLGMMAGEPVKEQPQTEITQANYIDAEQTGLWYPLKREGMPVKQGEVIGMMKDIWGNCLKTYEAEFDGIVLYLALNLAIKAGDFLIAYGKI